MEIISDIERLEPLTKKKVYCLLDHAKMIGLDIFIFESLRTQERQRWLLWWGRTATQLKKEFWVSWEYAKYKDAKWKVNPQRTRTLVSKHLTGEAVDIVFDANSDPKIKAPRWSWNYGLLIAIWKMYWLDNLAPVEVCHFQNNGRDIKNCIANNSALRNATSDEWMRSQLKRANDRMRAIKS